MPRYQRTESDTKAIEAWLAAGNKITICETGARSDPDKVSMSAWGRRKKAAPKKEPKATKE